MKIPDPITQAAINVKTNGRIALVDRLTILKAVCAAISENPIVPTEEQETEMDKWARTRIPVEPIRPSTFAVEWQRRMFVEPEPEMIGSETVAQFCSRYRTTGAAAIEAYRLGQRNPK